jgi:NADPH-dependent glutamate synthase beta subunit-like oxidoreductase
MAESKSMIGELEIKATTEALRREIHILNEHGCTYKYGTEIKKMNIDSLVVKYTEIAPAIGHYESVVGTGFKSDSNSSITPKLQMIKRCVSNNSPRSTVRRKL